MKLTILGGGGFRTPYIFHELTTQPDAPEVEELVLFDPEEHRLAVVQAVLAQMPHGARAPRVRIETDARAALDGADAVFSAIRVGGLAGRIRDEHDALELGVLGQETTGPGGISFALRTVPAMVGYARLMEEVAPGTWLVNFTNPAGIITEAVQSVLGDRAIGVCDTPSGLVRRAAGLLGVDPDEAVPDYLGLNHLGWLRGLSVGGRELLPGLIADDAALAELEEGRVFGAEWVRALGAVPNEYLYYYYYARESLAALEAQPATRGDRLASSQEELFRAIAGDPQRAFRLWSDAVRARNASYMAEARGGPDERLAMASDEELFADSYAGVAIGVIGALAGGTPRTMILNVRNGDTIEGLPADAVVEVPARVAPGGPVPLRLAPPTLDQLALMQQVKAVERFAIRAALTGDRVAALKAFALHPLVDSVEVAARLRDAALSLADACAAADLAALSSRG